MRPTTEVAASRSAITMNTCRTAMMVKACVSYPGSMVPAIALCSVTSVRAGNSFFMTVGPFTASADSGTFHQGW
jgi:hypothetical protein